MIRENTVEKYLKKRCNERGWACLKFVSTANAGVPDRVVLRHGIANFVECKGPEGKVRPLQAETFKKLASYGFPVAVVYSTDDVEELIASWECLD